MCFYKSQVVNYEDLADHYAASFQSITEEVEIVREKFDILLRKDSALEAIGIENSEELGLQLFRYGKKEFKPANLSKEELTQMRWYHRFLSAYGSDTTYHRFYENGFDYFPTPIITAGEPDKFKMFRWGMIPPDTKPERVASIREETLNSRSERMWEAKPFQDAFAKAQRCLIPVTGFFEWRWLDEDGTVKVPYHVTFRDHDIRSMAGLYNRWKDPSTGEFYYSYTILTCPANSILEYVHNHKQRMPVFIDKENEQAWLNRDLGRDDVMDLCVPNNDQAMRAYTISKLLTTRNTNLNVPEVLSPFNYNTAIQEANEFLIRGEKKKAIEAFKNAMPGSELKEEHLQLAAAQNIKAELSLP